MRALAVGEVRVHIRYPFPYGTPDDESWLGTVTAGYTGQLDGSVMESAPQQRFASFPTVSATQEFVEELTSSGRWESGDSLGGRRNLRQHAGQLGFEKGVVVGHGDYLPACCAGGARRFGGGPPARSRRVAAVRHREPDARECGSDEETGIGATRATDARTSDTGRRNLLMRTPERCEYR